MKRSRPPKRGKPLARGTSRLARGPIKPGAGPDRGSALRARSPRKADHYADIADACREALERDRYQCRGRGLIPGHDRCSTTVDPQHVIPRSVRPDLADDPTNIIALCRIAHEWVGDHPEAAADLGLHGHSWDRP